MKVTVCQMHNEGERLATDWRNLVAHVQEEESELVVLPEMIFSKWLSVTDDVNQKEWLAGVAEQARWIGRFEELAPAIVLGSRPVVLNGKNHNQGFSWQLESSLQPVHIKYYLPEEPGYWEARWYERSPEKRFEPFQAGNIKAGMMLCTDIWFNQHARDYGQAGVDLLVCPRAASAGNVEKWVVGGRAAAVVSGAYCLSSNHAGSYPGVEMGGVGWVIDPEGNVLGLTSDERPFLTIDIDIKQARAAKQTYPRYVRE